MVDKNMRNIFYAVIMTVLMMLTTVSTTIASATIRDSNTITVSNLLEENEKTINTNETYFLLIFGFIIIDAIIERVEQDNNTYVFLCEPVEKVTIIGFGSYTDENITELHTHFYMKTFTNVSWIGGITFRKLEASEVYQHFSLFDGLRNMCVWTFI
jgi:hypothetical protein